MQLTPHFHLDEMTVSPTADAAGISNAPTDTELRVIIWTAWRMEIVRVLLGGKPITITSGFRNERVNKLVGGSPTSDHRFGKSVDFRRGGMGVREAARIIEASALDFDQLIIYSRHLHIGFGDRMRRSVFNA